MKEIFQCAADREGGDEEEEGEEEQPHEHQNQNEVWNKSHCDKSNPNAAREPFIRLRSQPGRPPSPRRESTINA